MPDHSPVKADREGFRLTHNPGKVKMCASCTPARITNMILFFQIAYYYIRRCEEWHAYSGTNGTAVHVRSAVKRGIPGMISAWWTANARTNALSAAELQKLIQNLALDSAQNAKATSNTAKSTSSPTNM